MCSSQAFRILVIDDVIDNLFLLQTILEAEGYEVDTAENGRTALEKVEASPPDLILMDVMMPEMNGYELTKELRQNKNVPFIPILMVTAHEDIDGIQGLAMGANDFIRKPIEMNVLLARVANFLQFRQRTITS